jgi:hypothetical protein
MAKLISYETGPRVIPAPAKSGKTDAFVMPGVNDIDPELFEPYAKDHPVIKHLLEQGEEGGLVYDAKTALKTLAGIKTVKECAELIKDTFNLVLLEQWLEAEERAQVQKLLESKIKDIKEPEKKPEGDKE